MKCTAAKRFKQCLYALQIDNTGFDLLKRKLFDPSLSWPSLKTFIARPSIIM